MRPYYAHGGIELYQADCREWCAWRFADMLVTDPPYGISWRRGLNSARGSRSSPGIEGDQSTELRDAVLAIWGSVKPAVVFGSLFVPPPIGCRHVCVWEKPPDSGVVGSTTGFRRDVEGVYLLNLWPRRPPARGSVLRSLAPSAGNPSSPAGRTGHPHAKPVDLIETLLMLLPPGMVADPCAGSGSVLVAAKNQRRMAMGVEIEERYCEIAARRLEQEVLDLGGVA